MSATSFDLRRCGPGCNRRTAPQRGDSTHLYFFLPVVVTDYDHAGRTIENWNKGLSHQKWIKARMEPYQLSNSRSTDPNLKSKKLVNPMEAVWKISVEEIPFIKAIPRKRNGRGEVVDVLGSPNEEGAEDEDNSMSLVTTSPEGQADNDQDGKERPVQKIKRFERMIGWERYVLDVVEEVRKGMGSVV